MATGAGGEGLFRWVYSGCISNYDNCVEWRPYHRNCSCALHNKSPNNCNHKFARCNNVSYSMRRAWSEGNLVLQTSSSSPSPSPSPFTSAPEANPSLSFCKHVQRGGI
ncbi:hypothetical protein Lal_00040883 [Lupinus albus]|uniref:Uncharacterized protein n=1 Tax=Lupinus albus TaxID=3870 RepID=A0A6A4PJY6_LUPAL|nr:hypothetical protein Lalb_Chr13g0301181 [Lupinus albus]KAF1887282.1 hypothetical protein Lal_00040883 [Lupinus albus]